MTKEQSDIQTEIAAGTQIRGRLSGGENVTVHGRIEGEVDLDGLLTVGAEGVLKADVHASRVIVSGVVAGDITAAESILLADGARVVGDLHAPVVQITEGARFSGGLAAGDVEAARREPARMLAGRGRAAPPAREPTKVPVPAPVEEPRAKTQVTSFVPAETETRKKRVVKKRR